MTTQSTRWTLGMLLDLFDVTPDGENRFTAPSGIAGTDERQVVEGSQVLSAALVAAAKRFPDKSIRSAYAVFARVVLVGPPLEFTLDVIAEGRSTATAVVTAAQNGKRCVTVTVLADVPSEDVIRHALPRPPVKGPDEANVCDMPLEGRQVRLVDIVDVNSPDEVGPPEIHAWLHYDPIPQRADLAKALEEADRRVQEVVQTLFQAVQSKGPDIAFANSFVFLDMFSRYVLAWQWLRQAVVAARALQGGADGEDQQFYLGKLQAARYFHRWELPAIRTQAELLMGLDTTCYEMRDGWF